MTTQPVPFAPTPIPRPLGRLVAQAEREIANARETITVKKTEIGIWRAAAVRALLRKLDRCPALADIEHVSLARTGYDTVSIALTLHKDRKDSRLPRELARRLRTTGEKSQGYSWETGLHVTFRLPTGRTKRDWEGKPEPICHEVVIRGYLPATCQLVEEEVLVPARTEKRLKVVCGD